MRAIIATRPLVAGLLLLILSACSAGLAGSPAVTDPAPSPTPDAYSADIDVGGRTLHIVCVGPTDTGRRTVVFEHGLGGDRRTWGDVLGQLKTTDRGCAYDRAGMEMSEPAPGVRTTRDQVEDLHALLAGAGIAPPYILVGHSSGGWNVMIYTATYPDEVAGIVLVDVRNPATSRRLLEELPPETAGESDTLHQNRAEFTTMDTDPSMNPENLDLRTSADQALATSGFGDRPTAILWARDTSGLWEGLDTDLAARMEAASVELQAEIEALAADPEVVVVDSGHDIPGERPDSVVAAIRSVIARIGD